MSHLISLLGVKRTCCSSCCGRFSVPSNRSNLPSLALHSPYAETAMFDTERFVADCRAAFAEDPTHKAIREVLASAVSNPTAVLNGLGEPTRAEIQKLFHSDALTIIKVVWAPRNDGDASQPSNVGCHRDLHGPRR